MFRHRTLQQSLLSKFSPYFRTQSANMSSYTTDRASPFTRAVVSSMRKLYPEALADQSFDNTGLLLEAPFDPIRRQMNSVLLTIDLTKAVADEAIERKDCVVVAYHPIIFTGLKCLTLADTKQQSLLRLALEGISVYSPHTAVDAAPGGLGDWLADIVTGALGPLEKSTEQSKPKLEERNGNGARSSKTRPQLSHRSYSRPTYPTPGEPEKNGALPPASHSRSVITPIAGVKGFESAGMGRIVRFNQPQLLTLIIERIARGVGNPKGFPVAIPQGRNVEEIQIRSVAICAGSGAHVLRNVDADLFFTGELSHHDALSATEQGRCVVTLFHSNSERGFLHNVLKDKLTSVLKSEWQFIRKKVKEEENLSSEWEDAMNDENVLVEVSEADRDPYGMVLLQSSTQVGKPLR